MISAALTCWRRSSWRKRRTPLGGGTASSRRRRPRARSRPRTCDRLARAATTGPRRQRGSAADRSVAANRPPPPPARLPSADVVLSGVAKTSCCSAEYPRGSRGGAATRPRTVHVSHRGSPPPRIVGPRAAAAHDEHRADVAREQVHVAGARHAQAPQMPRARRAQNRVDGRDRNADRRRRVCQPMIARRRRVGRVVAVPRERAALAAAARGRGAAVRLGRHAVLGRDGAAAARPHGRRRAQGCSALSPRVVHSKPRTSPAGLRTGAHEW